MLGVMPPEVALESRPVAPLPGPALLEIASSLVHGLPGLAEEAGPGGAGRTGRRILRNEVFDVWVLRWPVSSSVTPHDHGASAGALAVAHGQLLEVRWSDGRRDERALSAGDGIVIGRGEVHDVIGLSAGTVSVHVYSPPLSTMSFYDDAGSSVLYGEDVDEADEFSGTAGPAGPGRSAVDRHLLAARHRIAPRVQPEELDAAVADGALVIDTRPADLRARDGVIPGALVVERNVLEWRLDPGGSHRIEGASDPDRPVIVFCDEGYASSLAAASLLDLGRRNVTDLEGGYQAWLSHKRAAFALAPSPDR